MSADDDPDRSPPARCDRPGPKRPAVTIRRARASDIPKIYACQEAAYGGPRQAGLCDERSLALQLAAFPEGQLVATVRGKVVGYAASLIVTLAEDAPWYSYNEITGAGTFTTHDPAGDTLYGADIGVDPKYRGRGISGLLYGGRKRILKRLNLRRMVAGGRIPGYRNHAGKITAEEYVRRVQAGELKDPALNAHIKAGYMVRGVHIGYLRDTESLDYATFLEFVNADYRPSRRRIAAAALTRPVRRMRVTAAQYRMRPVQGWGDLRRQVEFFVSTAETYHSHFLVFPEFFTCQMFSAFSPDMPSLEGVARLAGYTERYLEMFTDLAKRSGLYIVGGTQPTTRPDGIYNTCYLFTPSGEHYTQDKLHVTPNERREYGILPGSEVKLFETDFGRIALVVCYDIEFPELARAYTRAGAEVFLVSFSTDERQAYCRVRYCAQARAVENYVYVVLAGNIGNLPQVQNFLLNYGEALVCTPCDVAFPRDGIAASADAHIETVVMADLDLGTLLDARQTGSVRPLRDARVDLFDNTPKVPVRVVRVR